MYLLAANILTEKVSETIENLTQNKLTSQEILTKVKKIGKLEIAYSCGTLIALLSRTRTNKRWLWELWFLPTTII